MIRILAIGLIGLILVMTIKQFRPELALILSLATGIVIVLLVSEDLARIIQQLLGMTESFGINQELIQLTVKIVGIAYLTEFGVQACKDSGENGIAGKLELCGKIAIFSLCLPVAFQILTTLFGILQEIS